MDIRSLTASIEAQAAASAKEARALEAEVEAAAAGTPFGGLVTAGSFHAGLAGTLKGLVSPPPVSSVKHPFTVVFQGSFNPRR